ncbi:TetR/AcrR family transcriptional regulator [Roseivirga sp. BDSF3-8]|uniref:TetR/AcrR family transcriptional regulator n=1 Tax=Roseivirga sp. BDSF3-8 TaxID=3241598 RepID=UPI0035325245
MLKTRKLSRKEQITKVATLLFRKKGYTAASMRDLATELGIEAASLYSHIRSKEQILDKICFRMVDAFVEGLNQVEQEVIGADAKLRRAIVTHIVVITRDTDASAVFFNEWRHLSNERLQEFLLQREAYEERFREIMREGIRDGVFKEVDARFATLTLLSSLNWTYNWYRKDGKMSPEEIGNQLADLLINGLKQ